jgi:hypothetical protein
MFLEVFSSLRGKVFSTIAPLDELKPTRKTLVSGPRKKPFTQGEFHTLLDLSTPGSMVGSLVLSVFHDGWGHGIARRHFFAPLLHQALL